MVIDVFHLIFPFPNFKPNCISLIISLSLFRLPPAIADHHPPSPLPSVDRHLTPPATANPLPTSTVQRRRRSCLKVSTSERRTRSSTSTSARTTSASSWGSPKWSPPTEPRSPFRRARGRASETSWTTTARSRTSRWATRARWRRTTRARRRRRTERRVSAVKPSGRRERTRRLESATRTRRSNGTTRTQRSEGATRTQLREATATDSKQIAIQPSQKSAWIDRFRSNISTDFFKFQIIRFVFKSVSDFELALQFLHWFPCFPRLFSSIGSFRSVLFDRFSSAGPPLPVLLDRSSPIGLPLPVLSTHFLPRTHFEQP